MEKERTWRKGSLSGLKIPLHMTVFQKLSPSVLVQSWFTLMDIHVLGDSVFPRLVRLEALLF